MRFYKYNSSQSQTKLNQSNKNWINCSNLVKNTVEAYVSSYYKVGISISVQN